ncbi:hypothetical protein [Paraglaciecola sp. 2405UD69-4]|uniref:hypothetical protein n=1 Tax=Paraglaciecola sp. 2405UD69-4 TaxID=3391836 RepID=UPI0039C9415F
MFTFKKVYIVLSFLLALSGCSALNKMAGLPYNEGNGYSIEHDKQIYGGGVTIEYRDIDFLRTEVTKTMNNRMSSESELEQALENLPQGGRILIHYEAQTIDAANTKWLEYVLLKDGKEVYRKTGTDSIANRPVSYSGGIGFWWDIDILDINFPFEIPVELVVVSNLKNKRDTFKISKP